jgi:hypothetical protein
MRFSRGMGAMNPKKLNATKKRMNGGKPTISPAARKVKKFAEGGKVDPRVAAAKKAEDDLRNYDGDLLFMDRSEIPPPEVQEARRRALYGRMIKAAPLGYKPRMLPGSNYGFKTPKEWEGVEQTRKGGGLLKRKK